MRTMQQNLVDIQQLAGGRVASDRVDRKLKPSAIAVLAGGNRT